MHRFSLRTVHSATTPAAHRGCPVHPRPTASRCSRRGAGDRRPEQRAGARQRRCAQAECAARTRALHAPPAAVVGVRATAVEERRLGRHARPRAAGLGRRHRRRRPGADDRLPDPRGRARRPRCSATAASCRRGSSRYDLATGFGLLQALAPLPIEPAPLGRLDRALRQRAAADRQRRRRRRPQPGADGLAAAVLRLLGIPHRGRALHRAGAPRPQRRRACSTPTASCSASAR